MKNGAPTRKKRLLAAILAVTCLLLASSVTYAAVVLFRSMVTGTGDAEAGNPGNDLTLTVTELTENRAVTASSAAFSLRNAGDSCTFSLALENRTGADLTHAVSLIVKSVERNGIPLTGDALSAVKSAILVSYDGVFVDTLARITEKGEGSLPGTGIAPAGSTDTHTLTLELHSAAEAYADVSVSLRILDNAANADAGKYLFIGDETAFSKAIDDINSGLYEAGLREYPFPTLVLTQPLTLTKSYEIRGSARLDLHGHVLQPAGNTLTVSGGTLTLSSSASFSAGAGTLTGGIVLNSETALLNVEDFSAADGTLVSGQYAKLCRVEACDASGALNLICERLRTEIGEGIPTGTSVALLRSLSFYADAAALQASGAVLENLTLRAPADLTATKAGALSVSVGAQTGTISFKLFGEDDEAVLAALKAGPLSHLEKLTPVSESITCDLFLPSEIKNYGVSIEWISENPETISDTGKLQDSVVDGKAVSLLAKVRINEKVYTLRYAFTVSSINNALRFSNFLAALSPLTLKEVWMGDTSVGSDDFRKSHQFLPNANASSDHHYRKAYTSPDASLTTARLNWGGYEEIGLTSLSYSQDATYNYISIYTAGNGDQAVLLNTPVFSTFAQIHVSATFEGDEEVYTGVVNIIIETGNYEQLLDGAFDYLQGQLDELDLYKSILRTRMQDGMAAERADFSLNTVYRISASSISAGKFSMTLDTTTTDGLLSALPNPLYLTYQGKQCRAYTLLDSTDGYDNLVTGSGTYIKVQNDAGWYYISAEEAGITDFPEGEETIDGTGKPFLPVTGDYSIRVDMTKASSVETRTAISVTVRYTYQPTVEATRTLYVTVPAVILPDSSGFANYSVFSSVKYQLFGYLPEAERIHASEAFETNGTTVTNHTAAYILVKDVERCSGQSGNWFDGVYLGEPLAISYGKKLDSLRFYVGQPDTDVNAEEAKIYDFLQLIHWATGRGTSSAADVLSRDWSALSSGAMSATAWNTLRSAVSDGNRYLTPSELNVLKLFYQYLTGITDVAWETLIASVSTTAPGRVITDGEAFGAAIRKLTSDSTAYFKYTELMRWALNEQNFPKSAFFGNDYPIGNPPNGGSLSYNVTYTTVSGSSYYLRQTGSNSLQSGYFNEDDTEYITDREEVVLQAFWRRVGSSAQSGFLTAYRDYSVVPTYLNENAVQTFVSLLYASFGYPKDYTAAAEQVGDRLYPYITSADGATTALTHFRNLTELFIVGATTTRGSTVTTALPAFLTTETLSGFFNRLQASSVAPLLTKLTLYHCADGYVEFDLTGISAFTALTYLDLGMNYGIRSIGPVLELDYRALTLLDVTGVGQADRYKDFTLNVIYNASRQTVLYTPDSGLAADGSGAEKMRYTKEADASETLAFLQDLEKLDGQYLQLLRSLADAGSAIRIYWQQDSGNRIYPSPVTSAGTFSAGTYGTKNTAAAMIALLTNDYYCSETVTVNGVTLEAGYVYSLMLQPDGTVRFDAASRYAVASSLPEYSDEELEGSIGGTLKHTFSLSDGTVVDSTTEKSDDIVSTSNRQKVYLSTNGSSNNLNSGTRYQYVYYVKTTTVTEYTFTCDGGFDPLIEEGLCYLSDAQTVVRFTFTAQKKGESRTGTLRVTEESITYYAKVSGTANPVALSLGSAQTIYCSTSQSSGYTNSAEVKAAEKPVAVYTYVNADGETMSATPPALTDTGSAALLAGIPSGMAERMKQDVTGYTYVRNTETTLYTENVSAVSSSAEGMSVLRTAEAVVGGTQTATLWLFGASASGTDAYTRNGTDTALSFASGRFYRLVFGTDGYALEDTGALLSDGDTVPNMEGLLAEANAAAATIRRGNYLGMYVFYNGTRTVTVNGRTYRPGYVYRMVWADDAHTVMTYDDADGGTRTCTVVSAQEFARQPMNATAPGGIYYLTEGTNYYAADRFYVMTFDDSGFYYLRTFGTAELLLEKNESGGTHAYLRLKNGRLYLTSGEDYSGTGGTEEIDLVAVILSDGKEYTRTFRVTVIG